ncbi:MAG: hypothetical protein WCJ70_02115 [bacterium]
MRKYIFDWRVYAVSMTLFALAVAGGIYQSRWSRSKPEVLSVSVSIPTVTPSPTPTPDPRAIQLSKYFAYRQKLNGRLSPLASHSALLVSEADRVGIDYRFVTTIATIESNQCQSTPDRDPLNCWGWGIYPGSYKEPFESHEQAIRSINKGLARNYHRKGHDTVEEIAQIYNPNTPDAWASKIHKIFDLIESL